MQREIIEGGRLLNDSGSLNEAGWARSLIKEYSRSDIKANPLRIKEWDYYLVSDGRKALALTIADNSYMGMYSASWLDFEEPRDRTNREKDSGGNSRNDPLQRVQRIREGGPKSECQHPG